MILKYGEYSEIGKMWIAISSIIFITFLQSSFLLCKGRCITTTVSSLCQTNSYGDTTKSKGAKTIPNTSILGKKKCRAVIVGISSYPNISANVQLRYAHKDAIDFYHYIVTRPEAVDSSDIKLLVNEQATMASVYSSLTWLVDNSKSGDEAIIFFSGHGDVDSLSDEGFLLLHNVRRDIYLGADALSMDLLIRVLNKLAIQKNTNVFVFADACRTGNLLGGEAKRDLPKYLSKSIGTVNRFLSCGENQESQENDKLQNGVFTHFLLEGLFGLADKDNDDRIAAWELCNYLTEKTSLMTLGHQIALCSAEQGALLASVNPDTKARLQREQQTATLAHNEEPRFRGSESELLREDIPILMEKYTRAIDLAIADGRLVEPSESNAWSIFLKLAAISPPSFTESLERIKYKLITASIGDAQKLMDRCLESGNNPPTSAAFSNASGALENVIHLLGSEHIMAQSLLARQYFLKASAVAQEGAQKFEDAIKLFRRSIEIEPEAAYAYGGLGDLYALFGQNDSAKQCLDKAIALAPAWISPRVSLSKLYLYQGRNFEARKELDDVCLLDSSSAAANIGIGYYYYYGMNDYRRAETYVKKAIDLLDPNNPRLSDYRTILGWIAEAQGDPVKAIQSYIEGIRADSMNVSSYVHLAHVYIDLYDSLDSADSLLHIALTIRPFDPSALYCKGKLYKTRALRELARTSGFGISDSGGIQSVLTRNRRNAVQYFAYAESLYLTSMRSNPRYITHSDYFEDLIGIYLGKGDTLQAESFLCQVDRTSRSARSARYLGDFYEKLGRYEEAERAYRSSVSRDHLYLPVYSRLLKLYKYKNIKTTIDQIIPQAVVHSAISSELTCDVGEYLTSKGDYEEAKDWFVKTIRLDSSYATAYDGLCDVFFRQDSLSSVYSYIFGKFGTALSRKIIHTLNQVICDKADLRIYWKDTVGAYNLLRKAVSMHWDDLHDTTQILFRYSNLSYVIGQIAKASTENAWMLSRVLEKTANERVRHMQANLLMDQKKAQNALILFENDQNDTDQLRAEDCLALALIYHEVGNETLSSRYYHRALERDSTRNQLDRYGAEGVFSGYGYTLQARNRLKHLQKLYIIDQENAPASDESDVRKPDSSTAKSTVLSGESSYSDSSLQHTNDPRRRAEVFFENGNRKHNATDYAQAIMDFDEAIRIDSTFSEAWFNRGLAKYNSRDFVGAVQDYIVALALDPNNEVLFNNLGTAKYRLQDFNGAIRDFTKAIELSPEYFKAYYNRALARACLQDYRGAIDDLTIAIDIDSTIADAYLTRGLAEEYTEDYEFAYEDFLHALQLNPDDDQAKTHLYGIRWKLLGAVTAGVGRSVRLSEFSYANRSLLLTLGKTNWELGRYDKALIYYYRLLQIDSSNVDGYRSLGSIYKAMDQLVKALMNFQKVLALVEKDVERADAYSEIGRLYYWLDDNDSAMANLDKAINLTPDDKLNYFFKGRIYFDLEQYSEAQDQFFHAIHLDSTYIAPYRWLGKCNAELRQYNESVSYYKQALKCDPDYVEAYRELGEVYSKLGDLGSASYNLQKAVEIDSSNQESYLLLGKFYNRQKQYDQSIRYLKKAYDLDSNYSDACIALGQVYQERKLYDEALAYYRKSMSINPDDASTLNSLGLIYMLKGNNDSAISFVRRAIKIDSTMPIYYNNLGWYFAEKGEYQPAIATLNKALQLQEVSSYVFYLNISLVYFLMNDSQTSREYFDKACLLEPRLKTGNEALKQLESEGWSLSERKKEILSMLFQTYLR